MNIDDHPLRYAKITDAIEAILFRRSLEKRLGGYVLETAIEIAESIVGTQRDALGQDAEDRK
jgi:hypothetical protein